MTGKHSGVVAWDTETYAIVPGCITPPLVCLSVAWDGDAPSWLPASGPDVVLVRPDALPQACAGVRGAALLGLEPALAVAAHLLAGPSVGANVAYDLGILLAEGIAPSAVFDAVACDRVLDVQVRERLIGLAAGQIPRAVSLAALAKQYLGLDLDKGAGTWRMRYSELDGIPVTAWPSEASRYALHDAAITLAVHRAQLLHAPATVDGYPLVVDGRVVSETREVRAALALHLTAAYGVRTDPAAVAALVASWDVSIASGVVAGTAGGWIRPPGKRGGTKDTRALQAVISAAYDGDPPMTDPSTRFPQGQVKTDLDTVKDAAARAEGRKDKVEGAEHLVTYAASLRAAKASSVWGSPLTAGTTRPITSRPLHLVATGRTSWSDPPWQQPPRSGGVRECVIPRPGYVLCSVDYEQAELVALAQVHLWQGLGSTMADTIRAGQDLHVRLACQLHTMDTSERVDYADGYARYKAGDPRWAGPLGYRQLAKVANFGFPGGLGAARFRDYARKSYGLDVSSDRAIELRNAWSDTWPEMREYFACVNDALDRRDAHTVRQWVSGRVRGGVGYCDGCNTPFQGLIADVAKDATWRLVRAGYGDPASAFYGSRPILMVHDEVIAELPIGQAHEAAEAMAAIMLDAARAHIPDVPMRAEPALMTRWSKSVKTARDVAGRLVVGDKT